MSQIPAFKLSQVLRDDAQVHLEGLQEIVKNDQKGRYSLILEADVKSGDEVWWIRANQGHSMKVSSQSVRMRFCVYNG